ncbi:MAG: hypothetical protein WDM80_05015 [Limisphaerales bacterium]
MTPAPGSVSSRNIFSTRTASPWVSHAHGYPYPQGLYYTGVGYDAVGCIAREIVEKHLDLCLDAGINHEGINAEVAKGQWEFQNLRQRLQERCRPDVDGALSSQSSLRKLRAWM